MNKNVWIAVVSIALVVSAAVWFFWGRRDPQLAKLDRMSDKLMSTAMSPETKPEERQQIAREFREEFEKLPEEERKQYQAEKQDEWMATMMTTMEKAMEEFFARPREEQIKEIDRILEQMKDPNVQRQMQGGGGGGGGMGPFGFMGGMGGQSLGSSDGKSVAVDQNMKMLNMMSPTLRASFDEIGRMMSERSRQLQTQRK